MIVYHRERKDVVKNKVDPCFIDIKNINLGKEKTFIRTAEIILGIEHFGCEYGSLQLSLLHWKWLIFTFTPQKCNFVLMGTVGTYSFANKGSYRLPYSQPIVI